MYPGEEIVQYVFLFKAVGANMVANAKFDNCLLLVFIALLRMFLPLTITMTNTIKEQTKHWIHKTSTLFELYVLQMYPSKHKIS